MRNIPTWFMAFLGLSIFCVIAGKSIYDERNDVSVSYETLQGDISAMDGVELDLTFSDYNNLLWDIGIKYNQDMEADVAFNPIYDRHYNNASEPQIMITGDNVFDKINNIIDNMGEAKKEVKLADYLDFLPIQFAVSFNGSTRLELVDENNLYKIKMPDSALAIIEKESNSTSVEILNLPYVANDIPSVIIGDRMYFTIPNLERANSDLYHHDGVEDIEYSLKSGILSIPVYEDKRGTISYSEIKTHYPFDLGHNTNEYIIGMEAVTEQNVLALIVLEDNKLYAHLYDTRVESLILKKEIGQIPENKVLRSVYMKAQEDYLLMHYEYEEEVVVDDFYKPYYMAEAYEIKNGDIHRLIENDYLNKLDNQYTDFWYLDTWNFDHRNLYYANGKMCLISRDHRQDGEANTGLLVMAIDNEDVLYFASISSSMMEDYTIGTTYIDENVLVRSNGRHVKKYDFRVE